MLFVEQDTGVEEIQPQEHFVGKNQKYNGSNQ